MDRFRANIHQSNKQRNRVQRFNNRDFKKMQEFEDMTPEEIAEKSDEELDKMLRTLHRMKAAYHNCGAERAEESCMEIIRDVDREIDERVREWTAAAFFDHENKRAEEVYKMEVEQNWGHPF